MQGDNAAPPPRVNPPYTNEPYRTPRKPLYNKPQIAPHLPLLRSKITSTVHTFPHTYAELLVVPETSDAVLDGRHLGPRNGIPYPEHPHHSNRGDYVVHG